MNQVYPIVKLGEIAIPIERPETPVPGKRYRQMGVKLWGEGAYERESLDGSQTQYKKLSRVEADDIIVNKIWARNGSVSVVPSSLSGCYVSGEFPTFTPIREKLESRWFYWLTKTKPFWEQCDEKSRGTSGKNRIRPEKFLEIQIPLPPLEEQRRIVTRVEEMVGKIEGVRSLRKKALEEVDILTIRTIANILDNDEWEELPLNKLLRENSLNGLSPRPSETPLGLPILRISAATSQADAIIDEADFKYLEVSEQDVAKYKLEPGDLLACRYNGNLHYTGKFALYKGYSGKKHLYPDKLIRFRVDTKKIMPEFARLALNSPKCRKIIESFCATTAGNIGLSAGNLKTVPVPVPPLLEQRRIVAYLNKLQTKVDTMKRFREEAMRELNALLPSILDKAFKGEL